MAPPLYSQTSRFFEAINSQECASAKSRFLIVTGPKYDIHLWVQLYSHHELSIGSFYQTENCAIEDILPTRFIGYARDRTDADIEAESNYTPEAKIHKFLKHDPVPVIKKQTGWNPDMEYVLKKNSQCVFEILHKYKGGSFSIIFNWLEFLIDPLETARQDTILK